MNISRFTFHLSRSKGQATTEMVLLLPLFMLFLFVFVKIFALLVLVQKLEVASFYAARRWQLESHRNVAHESWDDSALKGDILKRVRRYMGFENSSVKKFLNLEKAELEIRRTQVWQEVTLKVYTRPWQFPGLKDRQGPLKLEVVKYVPNRDRPIKQNLPIAQ